MLRSRSVGRAVAAAPRPASRTRRSGWGMHRQRAPPAADRTEQRQRSTERTRRRRIGRGPTAPAWRAAACVRGDTPQSRRPAPHTRLRRRCGPATTSINTHRRQRMPPRHTSAGPVALAAPHGPDPSAAPAVARTGGARHVTTPSRSRVRARTAHPRRGRAPRYVSTPNTTGVHE